MKTTHVAVTGLHAADNPAPGIGVIRSLRHEGWAGKIIGLAYDVYDTGIYDLELLDEVYMFPYPNQGSEEILARLAYIHEKSRIDVLIPTLDSELRLFIRMAPRLREMGIRTYLPSEENVRSIAKANLAEFCERSGISTPRTEVINDPGRLGDALDDVGFPLYVKGVFYDAKLCHTRDQALQEFERLRAQWGLPVLIQEAINGQEYDICCLGRGGELIGALPMRKSRLTEKGKAWAAVSLRNEKLQRFASETIEALGWSGPCELEVLEEEGTKQLYLLEINPRFPAWLYLGTGAEQNLPPVLVKLALGEEVEPLPPARSGITFVRHATDLVCPLAFLENLTVHGELHHIAPEKEE